MNNQQFFDTTAEHLFAQGKRSYAPSIGWCMYRGPYGTKCAVGVHIPDDKYDPKFEYGIGENWSGKKIVTQVLGLNEETANIAERLQGVHDEESSWQSSELMRQELENIALDYRLDASILDSLSFGDGR